MMRKYRLSGLWLSVSSSSQFLFFNQGTFTPVVRQVWHGLFALSNQWFGFYIPISLTFYAINFPDDFISGIRLGISLQSLPSSQHP